MFETNEQKKQFSKELRIRSQSFKRESLKKFHSQIHELALKMNFTYSSINLPIKIKKINVLKSPHVNKKARDLFEIRLYNRLFIFCADNFSLSFLMALRKFLASDMSVKISLTTKINV